MTSSHFKFLRRVRIHGEDCGAVARALHHEVQKVALTQDEFRLISDEYEFSAQAELKKAFGSTFNERKQMSTKTSIKRIALVAVSALGFGLLSVSPSQAATTFTANFAVSSTSLDIPTASVGGTNTDGSAGSVTINMSALDTALRKVTAGADSADSATVTLTSVTDAAQQVKNDKLRDALYFSTSTTGTTPSDLEAAATGYNPANNGTVAVTGSNLVITLTPLAEGFGLSSGRAWLNVERDELAATDSGAQVELNMTVASGGVIQTFKQVITLTIGAKKGTGSTKVTTGTITAGGTATATHTQPYTNLAAGETLVGDVFSITTNIAAGAPTFDVTGVATGGSVSFVRSPATTITSTLAKNALPGSLSVTYTITVTAPVTAVAGNTISVFGYTWTVQPTAQVYSYSTVTPSLSAGNGFWKGKADGGDGILYGAAANSNLIATFTVDQKDQFGQTITAAAFTTPVTATITGKGSLLPLGAGASVTKAQSWSIPLGNAAGSIPVTVYSDGTSGEGTLAITVNGVSVFSLTMRFYGDADSVAAVLLRPIGDATTAAWNGDVGGAVATGITIGGQNPSTSSPTTVTAIAVLVKDANGYVIPTAAPVAAISDRSVISDVARTFIDSGVAPYGAGTFYQHYRYQSVANASGKSAKVTFSFVNNAGKSLTSNEIVLTLGGAVAKPTLTFDKASYARGEVAKLTFTGLDSSGNKAYDGFDMVGGGWESNLSFGDYSGGGAGFASAPLTNGTRTRTTYAPLSTGTWIVTAYLADGTEYSATATVTDPGSEAAADAALEAIDAANAATDAANLAAEAADAATVAAEEARDAADAATAAVEALAAEMAALFAALKAQITTLANTVAKISKKVKA